MNIITRRSTIKLNLFWLAVSFLAIALFCLLGMWQLDRYQDKKNWLEAQSEQFIQGSFLPNFTIYLDNKIMNQTPGYEVLQAFQLENKNNLNINNKNNKIVLISRGWIAQPKNNQNHYDRHHLPEITLPNSNNLKLISLKAKYHKSSKAKYGITYIDVNINTNKNITHSPTQIRASRLDIPEIQNTLNKNKNTNQPAVALNFISDYYFSLPKESIYQLSPLPDVSTWLNPHKHLGYAVQWFAVALLTLFLYARFGLKFIKNIQKTGDDHV